MPSSGSWRCIERSCLRLGMSTLVLEEDPVAANVTVTGDKLTVELADGRSLTVPLSWYPRLMHGTDAERGNWQLLGDGHAIEWPDSTNTSASRGCSPAAAAARLPRHSSAGWHRAGAAATRASFPGTFGSALNGRRAKRLRTLAISDTLSFDEFARPYQQHREAA